MLKSIACASVLALSSASGAVAATTQYTSLNDFILGTANEGPQTVIDFETGFTDGQDLNGATVSGMTITAAPGEFARIEEGAGSIGGSNPIGNFALELGDNSGTSVTFSFANAITYFGFFHIDAGTPAANGFSFASSAATGNSAEFGGLTFDLSDNVTEVVFSSISGDGTWGLDSFVFGTSPAPVPVPAGLPLLLSGALAFGLIRRRQRG
ncbi:MAG: VPLPA-CTERM sorting domain-containing protein [Pseudomonadota bacterium]